MSSRIDLFLGERAKLGEQEDALIERRRAIEPPALYIRGQKAADITTKGDFRIGTAFTFHPEDVIALIAYLGRWYVTPVETVEVAVDEDDTVDDTEKERE